MSEYIETAIAAGLAEIGFSDHAPLPDEYREGITMKVSETETYLDLIESESKRYREKIIVRTGFEVDYPLLGTFDDRYFSDPRIDYLMGSCHFIDDWIFDHPDFIDEFERRDINVVYTRYFEILSGLVESGLFNIVGHFDLVKKFGHRATRDLKKEIEAVFSGMPPEGVAVEINTAGLRKPVEEIYPSADIVSLLFELNVPVTLGSDSHHPSEVGHEFPARRRDAEVRRLPENLRLRKTQALRYHALNGRVFRRDRVETTNEHEYTLIMGIKQGNFQTINSGFESIISN